MNYISWKELQNPWQVQQFTYIYFVCAVVCLEFCLYKFCNIPQLDTEPTKHYQAHLLTTDICL